VTCVTLPGPRDPKPDKENQPVRPLLDVRTSGRVWIRRGSTEVEVLNVSLIETRSLVETAPVTTLPVARAAANYSFRLHRRSSARHGKKISGRWTSPSHSLRVGRLFSLGFRLFQAISIATKIVAGVGTAYAGQGGRGEGL
jgi:hypothetical protein